MGNPNQLDLGGMTIVCTDIVLASTPGGAQTSLSATEIAALDGVTAGTATASKAVVLGASKNISTITSATITTLTATDVNTTNVTPTTIAGTPNFSGAVTAASTLGVTGLLTATGGVSIPTAKSLTVGAGTATVAPLNLTSGTNLTTAAAGAIEFDGKVFYTTAAASSRQVCDAEQFIIQTANSSTYNNTVLDTASAGQVFSTGSGALTVQGTTTYFFEGLYKLSNTGTTSHTWATLFALTNSATLTGIQYTVMGDTRTTSAATIAATSMLDVAVATQVPVTAASTSATEFVTLFLKGYMAVNVGGTVTPQLQASARPGATGTPGVVVLAGSYFRMWPVGTNSVASVGNWA